MFLTADAFGVLPPISRLTREQAAYHFISGYTAKVAGTEIGVKEPSATFSGCSARRSWPGTRRVRPMLMAQLEQYGVPIWLVNTGWTGGAYGEGKRMNIAHTRNIRRHRRRARRRRDRRGPDVRVRGSDRVPGVPDEVLFPRNTWADKEAYDATARRIAGMFHENFAKYADGVSEAVRNAGPSDRRRDRSGGTERKDRIGNPAIPAPVAPAPEEEHAWPATRSP